VLVTCALRRGELSRMNCEHLAMRDGRWVFLDFKGKGNKTRSVAVPLWVKQAIDGWLETAGIEKGPIFRRVSANGRVGKNALTERAVWPPLRRVAHGRWLIVADTANTRVTALGIALTAHSFANDLKARTLRSVGISTKLSIASRNK
jgi:integrase